MSSTALIILLVGIGAPLLFLGIVAIIVLAGRARPQAGLGPRPDPSGTLRDGEWNAQILSDGAFGRMGGALGSVSGRFRVEAGTLAFLPAGPQPTPLWEVPCAQVVARAHSAFSTAGVELWLPAGHLRCNVSREHINLATRNTIKTLREPQYYREFVGVLVANGARAA